MEEKKKLESPMEMEEFKEYLNTHQLLTTNAAGVYKSLNRAIKRGHVTPQGYVMPDKPYNNRANTSKRKKKHSRTTNEFKRKAYGEYRDFINGATEETED